MRAPDPGIRPVAEIAQFLTFLLAGEEYGVDILQVQEIKGWERATRIPHTPDYVLGVLNLRGSVVPILDLRRRFGLASVEFGATSVVIVLHSLGPRGKRTVGIVVDAVSEVYHIDHGRISAPPDLCGQVDALFVKALALVEEKMVLLLDVDRLIGSSLQDAA